MSVSAIKIAAILTALAWRLIRSALEWNSGLMGVNDPAAPHHSGIPPFYSPIGCQAVFISTVSRIQYGFFRIVREVVSQRRVECNA